ncbi:MAG: Rnase Y domain-containing protein, partial [Longimicrobiales bacterium]
MDTPLLIGAVAIGSILLVLIGWGLERLRLKRAKEDAESEARRIRQAGTEDADRIRKAAELAGKEEAYHAKQEWEREEARRREDVERAEVRIEERRTSLDRKYDILDQKARVLEEQDSDLDKRSQELQRRIEECQRMEHATRARLEALAGLTAEEAKRQLMQQLEEQARASGANLIREIKENAKREADREAKNILALAIQR